MCMFCFCTIYIVYAIMQICFFLQYSNFCCNINSARLISFLIIFFLNYIRNIVKWFYFRNMITDSDENENQFSVLRINDGENFEKTPEYPKNDSEIIGMTSTENQPVAAQLDEVDSRYAKTKNMAEGRKLPTITILYHILFKYIIP